MSDAALFWTAYAVMGLIAGSVVSVWDYRDDINGGSAFGAGVAGLGAALFWPPLLVVFTLGLLARYVSGKLDAK